MIEYVLHVNRIPKNDGIGDQAQYPKLILLAFAVALANFTAAAMTNLRHHTVATFVLYDNNNVYETAMAAKALQSLYSTRLTPNDITNPVLNSFLNASLPGRS